ncbi:MAG: undecaprenyl-diphosphate phosphatase [Flavobacteriales bacterium]|nr:undecaprenyl-diphosphate phosphatase [Flavobacteriales bacterium]
MSLIEAIILGIIQGLTEFLPVSSSGHLELGKEILSEEGVPKEGLLFSVIVHAATALSTIVIYRKDILQLLKGLLQFKWNEETQFTAKIALSMLPILVVGLAFEDQIEALFNGNILFVGAMLLVTSALLFLTHFAPKKSGEMSFGKSIIAGLAQAVAILPGISRSGSTIATSLLLGVNKEQAARFSFLMVLPPILGAALLKFKKYLEAPVDDTLSEPMVLGAGFIAAFVAGLIACTWMIKIVKRSKLTYFAIYCALVGVIAIAYGLL